MKIVTVAFLLVLTNCATAQNSSLRNQVTLAVEKIDQKLIGWRRDFHEHPELGNQEIRTSAIIAQHLRLLGMEVKTGVAHTGVVGILKGGKS